MKVRLKKRAATERTPATDLCNARRSGGGLCRRPAGAGTEHLGQGRCRRHGGNAGSKKLVTGWYSQITHRRIQDLLGELAAVELNAMDLIPEANLLRAMTVDYVNRYEEFSQALMAWHLDPKSNQRPRRVMDIQDAAHLIESISRVIQRMHQIQSQGAISLESFNRVTSLMGQVVTKYVKDPLVLNKIEKDWMTLAIDSKSSTTPSEGE